MPTIGQIHVLLAVAAIGSGALVLRRRKGDRPHRRLGWVFVGSMVGTNVTALSIYRLLGHFGPFHFAAIVSLATTLAAVAVVVRRRPVGKWVEVHYRLMTWSYVGLLAAAASEAATRIDAFRFWWSVLAATTVVCGVGGWLIYSRMRTTIAPFLRRQAAPGRVGDGRTAAR